MGSCLSASSGVKTALERCSGLTRACASQGRGRVAPMGRGARSSEGAGSIRAKSAKELFGHQIERDGDAYFYPELERDHPWTDDEVEDLAEKLRKEDAPHYDDKDELEDAVSAQLQAEIDSAPPRHHRLYSEDPLFTHPNVVRDFERQVAGYQTALLTRGQQRGIDAADILSVPWKWAKVADWEGPRDELGDLQIKEADGKDEKVVFWKLTRETFVPLFIGGEVEGNDEGLSGALNIRCLARASAELPTNADEFRACIATAKEQWQEAGDRVIWLEAGEDQYPSGIGTANRYDVCEISRERLFALLDSLSDEDFADAQQADFAAKVIVEKDGVPQIEFLMLKGGAAGICIRDIEPDIRHASHWLPAARGGSISVSR